MHTCFPASLVQNAPHAHTGVARHVFVSHADSDAERIGPELDAVRAAGVNLWSRQDQAPGSEPMQSRADALSQADTVLVYLSRAALRQSRCMDELQCALTAGKAVITVYLEPVALPNALAEPLSRRPMLYRDDSPDYQRDLLRVLDAPPPRRRRSSGGSERARRKLSAGNAPLLAIMLLGGVAVVQAVYWLLGMLGAR